MMRDTTIRLTPAGRTKLEEELDHLVSVKRPDLAAQIIDANELGDTAANSEFEDLKESAVLTDARIQDLQFMLDRAETIEPRSDDTVGLGSTVTIRGGDDVEETWTLVSAIESDIRTGAISTESPVGEALFGKRKGDTATVETPGGAIAYTILSVE